MSSHRPIEPGKVQRQKRLEEQLRDNLKKRKAQAKARRSLMDEPDDAEDKARPGEGRPEED
ncbi:hypothetical protein LA66_05635 [Aureimonas altamirensis]|uniref:Uncharacterized protein n=1 Tax=Aureimonas altamirensis TaxID=370622 RepID=A0A0B1QB02_9HYPH|nr:hypothetical protein [Aureimonas altamirensis]KHJ56087.1 hypothetical protein LA66_05635 [Aureimonas altamirensis]